MIFGTNLSTLNIGLVIKWKEAEKFLYLRALGRNPTDPSLQDNVLIPNNFLEYIYHIGCAVNLHSITNSGLIAGGQKIAGTDRRYSLRP